MNLFADALNALLLRVPLLRIAGCILLLSALILYFEGYCRLMEPRTGTLEWMDRFTPRSFSLSRQRTLPSRRDAVPLTVLCLLTAAAGLAAGFGLLPEVLLPTAAALLPAYLLMKLLCGKSRLAVLGVVVLALSPSLTTDWSSPAALLLCLLFLLVWSTADYDAPLSKTALPLILSALCFTAAVVREPAHLAAAIPLFFYWLITVVSRFRQGGVYGRKGRLAATVLLSLLLAAVLGGAALALVCWRSGRPLPGGLLDPSFYRALLESALSPRPRILWLGRSFTNPLLWWGGLLAVLAGLSALIVRKSPAPVFLCFAWLAALPGWLCSGSCAFTAVSLLALCQIWVGFFGRGHRAPAYVYFIVCAAVSGLGTVWLLL